MAEKPDISKKCVELKRVCLQRCSDTLQRIVDVILRVTVIMGEIATSSNEESWGELNE